MAVRDSEAAGKKSSSFCEYDALLTSNDSTTAREFDDLLRTSWLTFVAARS